MKIAFEKVSIKLLEEHQVTPEQYVAWAITRFRQRAFRAGAIVSAIVFILLFVVALSSRSGSEHPGIFWYIFCIDIFITLLFLSVAFGMKNGTAPTHVSGGNPTDGYHSLDLMRYTSTGFMKKITEQQWLGIAAFDLVSFDRTEAERNKGADYSKVYIEKLRTIRQKLKKMGFLSVLAIVVLTAMVILVPQFTLQAESTSRYPLLIIYILLYCIAITGLHGWVFIYALIGFITREIKVSGEYYEDDMIYRRKSAIIWSVSFMFITTLTYIGFMIVPIAIMTIA
ncbi:MAG: hypothetical protein H8D05_00905 [FCB group bacterium]|nr:hypothetical protein [FCB group bacterium]